jgi:hypothetical protein
MDYFCTKEGTYFVLIAFMVLVLFAGLYARKG